MSGTGLSRLGVHASVSAVFPPGELRDELADLDADVVVVDTDDVADCDALVTSAYDASLSADLQWIHSIQAGVDRFPFDDLRATSD